MDLVEMVYKSTESLPKEEQFGLFSQIRRSAVSIPSNIAEGSGRGGDKEFVHFLRLAAASSYELETQLILAQRLQMIALSELENLAKELSEIQKMLYALINKYT